jgi:hypothetical protein
MGEAYGGGVYGRLEQFYDAIPGGMRGPQAPFVRMAVTGGIAYGVLLATAPMNRLMFYESGEAKPWSLSQEGANVGAANSTPVPAWLAAALIGAAAGTFV